MGVPLLESVICSGDEFCPPPYVETQEAFIWLPYVETNWHSVWLPGRLDDRPSEHS